MLPYFSSDFDSKPSSQEGQIIIGLVSMSAIARSVLYACVNSTNRRHLDSSAGCPRPSAPLPSYPVPRAHPGFLLDAVCCCTASLLPRKSRATKRRAILSSPSSSLSVSAKRYREEPQPAPEGELDVS